VDTVIPPVVISYKGIDADNNMVELGQLGQSMQGAAKLLGAAANLVATGQYAKKSSTFAVRVLVAPPRSGSVEIQVYFEAAAPLAILALPTIGDLIQDAAKRAVEAIVNFAVARLAKKEDEATHNRDIAEKALTEMGLTTRRAFDAIERIALNNGPAVRMLVTPIGESVGSVQVGSADNGAFAIDTASRLAIESNDPYDVGPEATFEILIDEIDLRSRSCKFVLREDDDPEQRYKGEITDPQITLPHNPYSTALNNHRWIHVRGKPRLKDGEIERLYISDVVPERTEHR
jgi:hypothetical protein